MKSYREIELKLKDPWMSTNEFSRQCRNSAANWAAQSKLKQQWASEFRAQLIGLELEPLVDVTIDAYRFSVGSLDDDNLKGSLKPYIDILKPEGKNNPHGLGLILEDRKKILKSTTCHEMKPLEGEGSVFIICGYG